MQIRRSSDRIAYWTRRAGASIIVATIAFLPLAVHAAPPAQDEGVDPAVRAAIEASAAGVYSAMGASGAEAARSSVVAVSPEATPESTPEATPEPTEEPAVEITDVVTAEVVIEEPVEVTSTSGVTLLAPANWNGADGSDSIFVTFLEDGTKLEGQLQDFGDSFPGLIIFPIFEGQPDALVASFGEGAVSTGVSHMETEQGLPVLRLGFGNVEGVDGVLDGVIYMYAPGGNAYGLFFGASQAAWPQLEAAADAVARSVTFPESLRTLVTGESGGTEFADPGGEYTLTLPEGWFASQTKDDTLRTVFADPKIQIVGATIVNTDVSDDSDEMKSLTQALAGSLSDADAAALLREVVSTMNLDEEDIQIDDLQTQVLPGANGSLGIIKLGGSVPINDGPTLPVTLFLNVNPSSVGAVVLFGDPQDVADHQETLIEILESVKLTE